MVSQNVVKAYSLYDEEVGYCQGLQFIVGPLLLNVSWAIFKLKIALMTEIDARRGSLLRAGPADEVV